MCLYQTEMRRFTQSEDLKQVTRLITHANLGESGLSYTRVLVVHQST